MMVQAEENVLMTTRYPENSLDEPELRKPEITERPVTQRDFRWRECEQLLARQIVSPSSDHQMFSCYPTGQNSIIVVSVKANVLLNVWSAGDTILVNYY